MAKTHPLGFRVEPEVKAALERAAKADRRSVSSLIEKILYDWLREHSHLSDAQSIGGNTGADQDAVAGTSKPSPPRKSVPRAKTAAMSKEAQIRALRERDGQ